MLFFEKHERIQKKNFLNCLILKTWIKQKIEN